MVEYLCYRCGYIGKQKNHLKNHLNRKNICKPILDNISIEDVKKHYELENSTKLHNSPQNLHNFPQNLHKNTSTKFHNFPQNLHNFPQFSKIPPQFSTIEESKYSCLYCNKVLSRSDSLQRHMTICKKKKECEIITLHNKDIEIEEKNKQIKELEEKIKTQGNTNIVNNTNNTNNTITNNIHINNYGDENLKHLRSKDFASLLSGIYNAVPKLIEKIHFDPEHPENQNIKYTNRKQPYLKVMKDDKWQLVNKKNELLDLIDNKYFMLKEKYYTLLENNKYTISEEQKAKIDEYMDKYNIEDKKMMIDLMDRTELMLLNNS